MSANTDREQRAARRSSSVDIRGTTYNVHEWGDPESPMFLYLHGWGDTGSTFQFVVDALQRDWHVVAPDWRGFGDSRGAASSYYFPDYLADLDKLLMHYSPERPAALVGHSMGGNIAGLFAGVMPERVSAFVNIEGFGMPDSDPARAPARYRTWIERGRESPAYSEYADFDALANRIHKRNPRMSRDQALFVARCWARRHDDGVVRLRADPLHKLPNPVLYRRAEAEACWQRITAAVLAVFGSDSPWRELEFPVGSALEIDLSGHMLHFEAPRELAHAIETFLGALL